MTGTPRASSIWLAIVAPISLLVGWMLLWENQPRFFFNETHAHLSLDCRLPDMCNPDLLAGAQHGDIKLSHHACLSLFFSAPTKLLLHRFDAVSIHRFMRWVYYVLLLSLITALCRVLELPVAITFFFLIYYGLSEKALSLVYEARLAVVSAAWLAGLMLYFAILERKARKGQLSSFLLLVAGPPLAALAYEAYIISRPLALAATCFLFVFVLAGALARPHGRSLGLLCLIAGLGWTLGGMLLMHPEIQPGIYLLGSGHESIASSEGELVDRWTRAIWDRLSETRYLFHWPRHSSFGSESAYDCGWVEIFVAFAILSALAVVLRLRRPCGAFDEAVQARGWSMLFYLCLAGVALVLPYLSTTFLRALRFQSFYLLSVAITCLLAAWICAGWPRYAKPLYALALLAAAATVAHRVPAVLAWQPNPDMAASPPGLLEVISRLRELPAEPAAAAGWILVCDEALPEAGQLTELEWRAAVYAGNLACKLAAIDVEMSCECPGSKADDPSIAVFCLRRARPGEREILELTRAPVKAG